MNTHQADQITDAADVPAVPPAPPFDSFAAVMALVQLAVDERAVQNRLAELKATEDRVAKELRKLEHVREGHDRAVARDRAEIAAERSDLAKRQVAAERAEASLAETKERIAEFHRAQQRGEEARRFEQLPGGGVRDWGPGGIWRDDAPRERTDPIYDAARPSAASGETDTVKVPGAGHTLTRSIPKPRRSMRRGADL
jgi:hypothetical protein